MHKDSQDIIRDAVFRFKFYILKVLNSIIASIAVHQQPACLIHGGTSQRHPFLDFIGFQIGVSRVVTLGRNSKMMGHQPVVESKVRLRCGDPLHLYRGTPHPAQLVKWRQLQDSYFPGGLLPGLYEYRVSTTHQ